MIVAWMFWSMRPSARFRSSPVMMTAVVVPSPHSWSWVLATSTSILAAGCSTSISLRIVTPSFVTTTSPMESTSILSSPRGPRVDRTASAIAFAAWMLFERAPRPFSRFVPSFSTRIGVCPVSIVRSRRDSSQLSAAVIQPFYLTEWVPPRARPVGARRARSDGRAGPPPPGEPIYPAPRPFPRAPARARGDPDPHGSGDLDRASHAPAGDPDAHEPRAHLRRASSRWGRRRRHGPPDDAPRVPGSYGRHGPPRLRRRTSPDATGDPADPALEVPGRIPRALAAGRGEPPAAPVALPGHRLPGPAARGMGLRGHPGAGVRPPTPTRGHGAGGRGAGGGADAAVRLLRPSQPGRLAEVRELRRPVLAPIRALR